MAEEFFLRGFIASMSSPERTDGEHRGLAFHLVDERFDFRLWFVEKWDLMGFSYSWLVCGEHVHHWVWLQVFYSLERAKIK